MQDNPKKKPLKIPHYANGEWRKGHAHGSREDRQQLVDFDKAVKKYGNGKVFEGLGFAMLSDWNMIAVDFDDCVDKETRTVHPMVHELVTPTYWEYSPSGKGVRAFFSGTMRDAKLITKRAKEVGLPFGCEIFNSKGFVTVTGDIAPEVELLGGEIVPITDEFRAFFDKWFGARDVSMKNDTQPPVGATDEEIARMLELWDATCDYQTWLNVGMAIHHETDGAGFDLWHDWSAKGANYGGYEECKYKWESFGRSTRGSVKTLRWMIHEKPIDFSFENVGNDFKPLPKKVDKKTGKEVRTMPNFVGIKDSGEIPATAQNILRAVRREDVIGWEFKKDTFQHRAMVQPHGADDEWRNIEDEDYTYVQVRLDELNFKNPPMDKVRNAVAAVSRENAFHSAQFWLNEVVPEWDGVPRIANYAKTFLGCIDDEEYARAVSTYAWTAHAARVLFPGCKADMMAVLIGSQGVGKSSNIQAIAPDTTFFTEVSFGDEVKTNIEKTIGKLVVEVAEMDGMSKRDSNTLRSYVSRQEENMRLPYERNATQIPRTFIMWGSTNDEQFLTDPTGNRRYLPIHVVGSGDLRFTEADRMQHWAEARELVKKHGGIVDADKANKLAEPYRKRATIEDPWKDLINRGLRENKNAEGVKLCDAEYVTTKEILSDILFIQANQQNRRHALKLRPIMEELGYERTTHPMLLKDGSRQRVWKKEERSKNDSTLW
jgi:predicted P-loop ATPase